jgi:RecA/RadA recombinase
MTGERHTVGRQVKLVVVDSVPFHFRQDLQDVGERTRLLSQIGQNLMALAGRHDICVRTCNGRLHWQHPRKSCLPV